MALHPREMEPGVTRVRIRDTRGLHHGTITAIRADGTVNVKWDRGLTERLGPSQLDPAPAAPDYPILSDIRP